MKFAELGKSFSVFIAVLFVAITSEANSNLDLKQKSRYDLEVINENSEFLERSVYNHNGINYCLSVSLKYRFFIEKHLLKGNKNKNSNFYEKIQQKDFNCKYYYIIQHIEEGWLFQKIKKEMYNLYWSFNDFQSPGLLVGSLYAKERYGSLERIYFNRSASCVNQGLLLMIISFSVLEMVIQESGGDAYKVLDDAFNVQCSTN